MHMRTRTHVHTILQNPAAQTSLFAHLFSARNLQLLADPTSQELTVTKRLTAGACAGMTASALTHPLDTARLRLALPNHPYKGQSSLFASLQLDEFDFPGSWCSSDLALSGWWARVGRSRSLGIWILGPPYCAADCDVG